MQPSTCTSSTSSISSAPNTSPNCVRIRIAICAAGPNSPFNSFSSRSLSFIKCHLPLVSRLLPLVSRSLVLLHCALRIVHCPLCIVHCPLSIPHSSFGYDVDIAPIALFGVHNAEIENLQYVLVAVDGNGQFVGLLVLQAVRFGKIPQCRAVVHRHPWDRFGFLQNPGRHILRGGGRRRQRHTVRRKGQ